MQRQDRPYQRHGGAMAKDAVDDTRGRLLAELLRERTERETGNERLAWHRIKQGGYSGNTDFVAIPILLLAPPLALLIFGWATGWAFRGFRTEDDEQQ
jgi:hypothetical protein